MNDFSGWKYSLKIFYVDLRSPKDILKARQG